MIDFGMRTYVLAELPPMKKIATDIGLITEYQAKYNGNIQVSCIMKDKHQNSDRTKSATIYNDSNRYYCHGCHVAYNSIELYAKFNNMKEEEAIEKLIEKYNVVLEQKMIDKIEAKKEDQIRRVNILKEIFF